MLPLEGITVLDLTRFLPGAMATMCLVRFGAEVIKIERPGEGDPARHLDGGKIFAYTNAGKKSIAIDLKHPKGSDLFRKLAQRSDVVLENFRPGVMERLNIGYDVLSRANERLIYVALTGYDSSGPMRGAAGHDINYISISGVLDLLSPEGATSPRLPGIQLADIAGGSHQVTIGILLALLARHRTGVGQRIDVAMATSIGELLAMPLSAFGTVPDREDGGLLAGRFACYNLYRCSDNRWIAVGALEPKFWRALCMELNREDLVDQQFSSEPIQTNIKECLSGIFANRSASHWIEALGSKDCCVTLVHTFEEAYVAGQFQSYSVGLGARLSGTRPLRVSDLKPPTLGEHATEISERLQLSNECLKQLLQERVIQ